MRQCRNESTPRKGDLDSDQSRIGEGGRKREGSGYYGSAVRQPELRPRLGSTYIYLYSTSSPCAPRCVYPHASRQTSLSRRHALKPLPTPDRPGRDRKARNRNPRNLLAPTTNKGPLKTSGNTGRNTFSFLVTFLQNAAVHRQRSAEIDVCRRAAKVRRGLTSAVDRQRSQAAQTG